ncbi:AfaD family invasin (plasmid) [Yersinia sp. HM-2024]|uniref:AfaD family invasin n=1 Tax=Yersinia sp. HM-2024 TaxID=3344550 RepID=UPI00370D35D7
MRNCRLVAVVFAGMLWCSQSQADDGAQIVIRASEHQIAGYTRDGTRIARGYISSDKEHAGFKLWPSGTKTGTGNYILFGQQKGHMIYVEIKNKNAIYDNDGLLIFSKNTVESFEIITKGNQYITADSYQINITGGYFKMNL